MELIERAIQRNLCNPFFLGLIFAHGVDSCIGVAKGGVIGATVNVLVLVTLVFAVALVTEAITSLRKPKTETIHEEEL